MGRSEERLFVSRALCFEEFILLCIDSDSDSMQAVLCMTSSLSM